MDLFRNVMATLDLIVYGIIEVAYEVLLEIANVLIVTPENAAEFAGKIYTLLGIFMVFKITFSLINYLVNPDLMSDKAKGAGKIATNVVIVLVLIIITPTAFQKLYELQSAILEDDVIPRFILGTEEDGTGVNQVAFSPEYCEDVVLTASDEGKYLGLLIFRPFFQPSEIYSVDAFKSSSAADLYCNSDYVSVGDFLTSMVYNKSPNIGYSLKYYVNYNLFISTAVGIFVALILISFCFDIAIRSIKLSFLQIVSPIPIISYIDPDSGKNGMFKKWLKMVASTWADLFIRLIAIFFALYIINLLGGDGNILNGLDGNEVELSHKNWVHLFIIIGALMFAKKLPSIITDLTGIKLGGMELNPFKRIEKDAVGGKQLGAIGGTAAGLGYGIVGAATGAGPGRILTGALGGFSQGFKGKKIGEIAKNQIGRNDVMRKARLDGSTFLGRVGEKITTSLGTGGGMTPINASKANIDKDIAVIDEQIKVYDDEMAPSKKIIGERKKIIDKIKSQEDRAKDKIKNGEADDISRKYLGMLAEIEHMKVSDGKYTKADIEKLEKNPGSLTKTEIEAMKSSIKYTSEEIAQKEMDAGTFLNVDGMNEYVDSVNSGTRKDATMKNLIADYEELAKISHIDVKGTADERHSSMGVLAGANSIETRDVEVIEKSKAEAIEEKRKKEADKRAYADQEKKINADKSTLSK